MATEVVVVIVVVVVVVFVTGLRDAIPVDKASLSNWHEPSMMKSSSPSRPRKMLHDAAKIAANCHVQSS